MSLREKLQETTIKKADDLIGSMTTFISKAQKDIFIYGGSLSQIVSFGEKMMKIKKDRNLKIRLLALNVDNPEIRTTYKNMRPMDNNIAPNLNHLKSYLGDENIEIRIHNTIPTAYYYAVDINEENGCIGVDHFLSAFTDVDYPHIEVRRGDNSEWYKTYQQQIEFLWSTGELYKNKE